MRFQTLLRDRRMGAKTREQVLCLVSGGQCERGGGGASRAFSCALAQDCLTTRASAFYHVNSFWRCLELRFGVAPKSCTSLCKAKLYDYSNGPYQKVRAAHGCGPHLLRRSKRTDRRIPGAQWRRQDHHHAHVDVFSPSYVRQRYGRRLRRARAILRSEEAD